MGEAEIDVGISRKALSRGALFTPIKSKASIQEFQFACDRCPVFALAI
jgi:hypothetical protein